MVEYFPLLVLYPLVIHLLDLFGTMAFAVTGSFKAIEQKADIVGVIILSIITGLAGGIIRDIMFGKFPPTALVDPIYLFITISTGITIFFLYPKLKRHWNLFIKFDAIGLGVFTIIGANMAYSSFGHNFLIMTFAGILTAIGGGIIRDTLVNEIPIVFVKELYVTASFVGVGIFYLLLIVLNSSLSAIISVICITTIRLLAIKYRWNLPRP
ncbi:MAG TPA: trimeric intracellular cation channel family protein, partial [Verrucomicrobiae bacterium]|nr:trimeric intracellular cation channel family protein [Verrucomicrobiae bacterium]